MGLNRIKGRVQKIEGQKAQILHTEKFNRLLNQLDPGDYELIIQPYDTKLKRMKKAYFAMESELARYLGYKKPELHNALKPYLGHKVCELTGRAVYESVADIQIEAEMMVRIEELHEWAAVTHQYTFPPYNQEEQ